MLVHLRPGLSSGETEAWYVFWLLDALQLEQSCWMWLLTMPGHPLVLREPTETHLPLPLAIKGMPHHARLFQFYFWDRGMKLPKPLTCSDPTSASRVAWGYKCVSLLGIHFLSLSIAYLKGS